MKKKLVALHEHMQVCEPVASGLEQVKEKFTPVKR